MRSQTKIFLFTILVCDNQKDLKIYSVNPLCLIFHNVNGYFEEINENMYLTLVFFIEIKKKINK